MAQIVPKRAMMPASKTQYSFFAAVFAAAVTVMVLLCGGKSWAISGANTFFPDTSPAGQGASYTLVQVTGSQVRSASGTLNAQTKMKARTTISSVYVPKNLVTAGTTVSLNIVDGCDKGTRDNDPGAGFTSFSIVGISSTLAFIPSNNAPYCGNGVNNVPISFTPENYNVNDPAFAEHSMFDQGTEYYIYSLIANGNMAEAGASTRYLNAFSVNAVTGSVLVGISDLPYRCENTIYTISCPRVRDLPGYGIASWVYSSFYGPWGLDPYDQEIKIRSSCDATGSISFYDIDAGPASGLTQPNLKIVLKRQGVPAPVTMLNGAVFTELPKAGIENWGPGIPGVLRSHPGFGGNNDEYLDMPGSDPTFAALGNFTKDVDYTIGLYGISNGNAFQILPSFTHCKSSGPVVTCTSMSVKARAATATTINVTVTLKNNTSSQIPVGTRNTGLHLGVAQAAGQTPPDFPNGGQWQPINSVTNLAPRYDELFAGQTYQRMPIGVAIPANGQMNYTFSVTAPGAPTPGKYLGVRVLDRTTGTWLPLDAACEKTIAIDAALVGVCPLEPTFFGSDYWIRNSNIQKPLPNTFGTADGYNATDYTYFTYLLNDDTIQNPRVSSNSGITLTTRNNDSTLEADYKPLVDTYPYDFHDVDGTANFKYNENFVRLIDVTAAWDRTVTISAAYTTVAAEAWADSTPAGAGWQWDGGQRPNATGGTEYHYQQIVNVPAVTEYQTAITVAYTAPSAPGLGGYATPWHLAGANARYELPFVTEKVGNAALVFPRMPECRNREFDLTPTATTPLFNDLEDPTSVTTNVNVEVLLSLPVAPKNLFIGMSVKDISMRIDYRLERLNGTSAVLSSANSLETFGTSGIGRPVPDYRYTAAKPQSLAVSLPPLQVGDRVCATVSINPSAGTMNSFGEVIRVDDGVRSHPAPPSVICSERIVNRPYLRAYSGDVLAGSGFGVGCTQQNSGILAYARQRGSNWVGAGNQLAGFASGNGVINGFATNSIGDPTSPFKLAFANTTRAGSIFGGRFGATNCADDFWLSKSPDITSSGPVIPALQTIASGSYEYSGGSTITAAGPITNKVSLFIDGDVTIAGTGIQTSTTWINVNAIPFVSVIVKGNIYVAPSVTQLDGMYVAMPNASSPLGGGQIFTCTDNAATPSSAAITNACANTLTVSGALVATRVHFLRTNGSLRSAVAAEQYNSATLAESIRYTPEMFLAKPLSEARNTIGKYDSIISLPPAL